MCDLRIPIFILLIGLFFQFGEAVHCWECNSKYDPNCGEPFKNHTASLADCSQRFLPGDMTAISTICRKITQKVQGETRVVRSCGFYNPEEAGQCTLRAGTHLVFMHYCQCKGEGCNTASPLYHSSYSLLVAFTIILIQGSKLWVGPW